MASSDLLGGLGEAIGIEGQLLTLGFAICGLLLLALSFHRSDSTPPILTSIGWILLGVYFFADTPHYIEINDPVLIFMSAAALPISIALGVWEYRTDNESQDGTSLLWLRGCVVWSAIPYLLVSWVPNLSVAVVWLTAWQGVAFLNWCGVADLRLGEPMVQYGDGSWGTFAEFTGNPWFYLEPLGEGGFYVPILSSDGGPAGVSIILACSALQSMIIFVGALVALRGTAWQLRGRALLITLPVIHVLNIFRNAGIIWLQIQYPHWHWMGIGMFDFAHSYAAKFGSLFAMFLMAIVLFELLPPLHDHILRLMRPISSRIGSRG